MPININYENVLEVDSLLNEWFGRTKKKENLGMFIRSLSILRQNFGDIIVKLGKPVSLKEYYLAHADVDFDLNLIDIGEKVADQLQDSTIVMNTSLVGIIFSTYKMDLVIPKFTKLVSWLTEMVGDLGGSVNIHSDEASVLKSLSYYGFFEVDQTKNIVHFRHKDNLHNLFKLMYYKNITFYLFVKDAIIVLILHLLLKKQPEGIPLSQLKSEYDALADLFKEETYKISHFESGFESYIKANKLSIYSIQNDEVRLIDATDKEHFKIDVLLSFIYPITSFIISHIEQKLIEVPVRKYEFKILQNLQTMHRNHQINSGESCSINYIRNFNKILEVG